MGAKMDGVTAESGFGFQHHKNRNIQIVSRCYSGHKGEQGSRVEDHYTNPRYLVLQFMPGLHTFRETNEDVEHNPSRAETSVLARESKSYEAE
jgi:hypothetical protein